MAAAAGLRQRGLASTHGPNLADKSAQVLKLSDGRNLGYAEYGNADGFPLFYFHGYPSSRVEAAPLDSLAKRLSIRLVAPDRPGFGLSTFQPNRRLTDWPADIAALAGHLGIKHFSVLGASGGGPYALACASLLPPRTLTSVGLLASAPPWEAGPHHMSYFRQIMASIATCWPNALAAAVGVLVRALQWLTRTSYVQRKIEAWLQKMDEAKAKSQESTIVKPENELTLAQRREMIVRLLFEEAFVQGTAGFVQETQLLIQKDWGFTFESVKHDNVIIWHGSRDKNSPISMIRYMADRIPNCTLHEWDETHYSMGHRLEEILKVAVSKS